MKAKPASTWLAGLLLFAAVGALSLSLGLRHRHAVPAEAEPGGRSLFQLQSQWTTDAGKPLKLAQLGGSVLVMAMIFTHCSSTCPTLVHDMLGLQAALPKATAAMTRFVLVTIDPERDTPEALREYRARMGLDSLRWVLLCGSGEAVRELAAVLGAGYSVPAGGDIIHSTVVSVLNPGGEIVHRQADISRDPARVEKAIIAAINHPKGESLQ